MNQKAEKFFDAITFLRVDLVEEAQDYVFRKRRSGWKTVGSLAACMVLVVSLGMLAILPRGCGAGGGDSSGSVDNAAPPPASCDPEEMPPAAGTDTAPPVGVQGPDGSQTTEAEQLRFMGQVAEVLEDGLLVEPFNTSLPDTEPLYVPTEGLEDLPAFYPGAVVEVLCGGISDGAAEDVAEIWLLEP